MPSTATKKRILIVASKIFPHRTPRANRATELAIELARQGHEVILYAALSRYDYTSFSKQYGVTVRSLGNLSFSSNGDNEDGRHLLWQRVLIRLFGRIAELPDIELLFRVIRPILRENGIDVVISIVVPHAINWGLALCRMIFPRQFPGRWIADCGDPYNGNSFRNSAPLPYFVRLERLFCRKADFITVPVAGAVQGYFPEFHQKIRVIPQGFRIKPISGTGRIQRSGPIRFAYAGTFYEGKRDPTSLLDYLCTAKAPFSFEVFTGTPSLIEPYLPKMNGKIIIHKPIPREELLKKLSEMDFLVNIGNGTNVQLPSKLIDYNITGRPVLDFAPSEPDFANVDRFLRGDFSGRAVLPELSQYDIANVARQFLALANAQ